MHIDLTPPSPEPTAMNSAQVNCELIVISIMAHVQLNNPALSANMAEKLIIDNGGCPTAIVGEA
jgi:hypothetical protein